MFSYLNFNVRNIYTVNIVPCIIQIDITRHLIFLNYVHKNEILTHGNFHEMNYLHRILKFTLVNIIANDIFLFVNVT